MAATRRLRELQAQVGNKNLRRLFTEESAVGFCVLWHLHVLGMLGETQGTGSPHKLCEISDNGFMVGDPDQEDGGRGQ